MQARICGGLGWATTQVYPARITPRKDELTSRQESSGKEDSRKLETFQMEPCG